MSWYNEKEKEMQIKNYNRQLRRKMDELGISYMDVEVKGKLNVSNFDSGRYWDEEDRTTFSCVGRVKDYWLIAYTKRGGAMYIPMTNVTYLEAKSTSIEESNILTYMRYAGKYYVDEDGDPLFR